ncbi:hypothetical protein A0H81_00693 [Grifola frondosa]|uniref:Uncharacterized protein n=1 Tax=Grifola frondosa TaxID=5627 RepID=A0A1C7MSQ8_GRIFR|nr:hypothetical protein A0H81_00693 [Grifola frondosa]
MVGLFGLGNKGSPSRSPHNPPSLNTPPPPYSQDNPDPSVFATETTTTTTHVVTTTTHTTTHFFSLPLWKRRGSPAYPPPVAPRIAGLSSDELGTIGSLEDQSERSVVLLRNKALPPTPDFSDENERSSSSIALNALHPNGEDGARIPRKKSRPSLVEAGSACSSRNSSVAAMSRSSYTLAESSSQPTVILARAALGLGLHHVTPNSVVASSSAMEVNTVAFGAPTSQLRTSDPSVRRVKSFQKDTPVPTQEPSPTGGHRERRRTRGLSLGPLHFSSDGKGKDKQRETENDTASPKPLSRKSLFGPVRDLILVPAHLPPFLPACSLPSTRSTCLTILHGYQYEPFIHSWTITSITRTAETTF